MKKILIPLLFLTTQATAQFTKLDLVSYTGNVLSGICSGTTNAYHADPTIFERRFHVSPYSFFGSESWQRNYTNNRYLPYKQHKHELLGNFGRDVWHTSRTLDKVYLFTSLPLPYLKPRPLHNKILSSLIGITLNVSSSYLTYKLLRK